MTTASDLAVSLTQALVRCKSITPAEGGALTQLENVLTPKGFVCHRVTFTEPGTPDVENLYARFGTLGPNLCFAGHTDVVPPGDEHAWARPPFGAEIHDGVLYGRGAADMKGAVACFAAAALGYLDERRGKLHGSISFLITGDEEGPSINGSAKLLGWLTERDERLDACIVGEPSNPTAIGQEIKIGRRGSLNGDLVVNGKQGHAAYPHLADNPVPKLARILDRLSSTPLDNGSEFFEPSSLQVTVISVPNTATNVIPAEARARLNIRYNDRWTRPKVEARVRELCAAAARELDARFELSFSGTGDVFLTQPGPLAELMVKAVETATGRTPARTTTGGTSDARFIHAQCPVIEFGLISATIHQVDERIAVADLHSLTAVYTDFIRRYFAAA